jgi:hypothetical protein
VPEEEGATAAGDVLATATGCDAVRDRDGDAAATLPSVPGTIDIGAFPPAGWALACWTGLGWVAGRAAGRAAGIGGAADAPGAGIASAPPAWSPLMVTV